MSNVITMYSMYSAMDEKAVEAVEAIAFECIKHPLYDDDDDYDTGGAFSAKIMAMYSEEDHGDFERYSEDCWEIFGDVDRYLVALRRGAVRHNGDGATVN